MASTSYENWKEQQRINLLGSGTPGYLLEHPATPGALPAWVVPPSGGGGSGIAFTLAAAMQHLGGV